MKGSLSSPLRKTPCCIVERNAGKFNWQQAYIPFMCDHVAETRGWMKKSFCAQRVVAKLRRNYLIG